MCAANHKPWNTSWAVPTLHNVLEMTWPSQMLLHSPAPTTGKTWYRRWPDTRKKSKRRGQSDNHLSNPCQSNNVLTYFTVIVHNVEFIQIKAITPLFQKEDRNILLLQLCRIDAGCDSQHYHWTFWNQTYVWGLYFAPPPPQFLDSLVLQWWSKAFTKNWRGGGGGRHFILKLAIPMTAPECHPIWTVTKSYI